VVGYVEFLHLPALAPVLVYASAIASVLVLVYLTNRLVGVVGLRRIVGESFARLNRVGEFLIDFLSHSRFLLNELLGGFTHLLLVVGLAISLVGTIVASSTHYLGIPYVGLPFLIMRFSLDLAALLIMISSLLGIYRVLRNRERYEGELVQYIIVLACFFAIAATGMLLRSYRIPYYLEGYEVWSPIASLLPRPPFSIYLTAYFAHFLLAFALIALIPATVLRHMLIAYTNYLLHDRPLGVLRKPFDLRELTEASEITMGYKTVDQFPPELKLMPAACTNCNRCADVCPANSAGRPLNPRELIRKILRAPKGKEFLEFGVGEDEVWSCTTCGACMHTCPVYIRHVDYLVEFRRSLVFESRLDRKKGDLLLSVSQYGNTMSQPNVGRHDWLKELGVKTVQENPNFEFLLWVGCLGSFDTRVRQVVEAFVDVLKKAGLLDKIAVLGDEETCCGDPLRRLGEESRFQELVIQNGEVFSKYGVRKIIVLCPHGYNTFKNEYPNFGVSLEVYHHVEFLRMLVERGVVRLRRTNDVVALHDPCYLARYNNVVQPQRELLSLIGELREVRRSGRNTFCCGGGGANYWYDVPERKRVSHIRIEELAEANANVLVTLCPFCMQMLRDAAAVKELKIEVKDIVELVRDRLAS